MKNLSDSINKFDAVHGHRDATVQIVIYPDLTHPKMIMLHQQVNHLLATFGNQIAVVYRPLAARGSDSMAFATAFAAVAAGKQGQFWEMIEQILTHQDSLTDGALRQFANVIGLDKARFEDDLQHYSVVSPVAQLVKSARDYDDLSIPAIFINGVRYDTLSVAVVTKLLASDS